MRFEWDPQKARTNAQKHDVTFTEAAECFEDPLAMYLDEPRHLDRQILIGLSRRHKLILTVYIEREAALIRIISARRATPHERTRYEEENG